MKMTRFTYIAAFLIVISGIKSVTALTPNVYARVSLVLPSIFDENELKEGEDIYMECKVLEVRPSGTIEVHFNKDGQHLSTDPSKGIFVSNRSLILQSIGRENSGFYGCSVTLNNFKTFTSNAFQLQVKSVPTCAIDAVQVIELRENETVQLNCSVISPSDPDDSTMSFLWRFRNEERGYSDFPRYIASSYKTSVLTVTPVSKYNFGIYTCYAYNEIGRQRIPCTFELRQIVEEMETTFNPREQLVELRPSNLLNQLREGDQVQLECVVEPSSYFNSSVYFYKEGRRLDNIIDDGIFITKRTLTIMSLSQMDSGNYSCIAEHRNNSARESRPISLKPLQAPVCSIPVNNQTVRIEDLKCQVDANPGADGDLLFRWLFASFSGLVKVPNYQYSINGSSSTLSRKYVQEYGRGTYACWAANIVGWQKNPCFFRVS